MITIGQKFPEFKKTAVVSTEKEFFELMSIAVSAVNGCEMCVKSHEVSLIGLGTSEERVFDAMRLSSVVKSMSLIVY